MYSRVGYNGSVHSVLKGHQSNKPAAVFLTVYQTTKVITHWYTVKIYIFS